MDWQLLLGSFVAVLALAATARWLKLGEIDIGDPAIASRIAEEQLAGFTAREALVGGDGGAALVAGQGALALLKRHGARVAARRLIPPLQLSVTVEGVGVDTGETMFGRVALFGVTDDEVRALEAVAQRPTMH